MRYILQKNQRLLNGKTGCTQQKRQVYLRKGKVYLTKPRRGEIGYKPLTKRSVAKWSVGGAVVCNKCRSFGEAMLGKISLSHIIFMYCSESSLAQKYIKLFIKTLYSVMFTLSLNVFD